MTWERLGKVSTDEISLYYANPLLLKLNTETLIFISDRDQNNCSFIKTGNFFLKGYQAKITNEKIVYKKEETEPREKNGVIANSYRLKDNCLELYCTAFHYDQLGNFISSPLVLFLDKATFDFLGKKYLILEEDGIPKGCGDTFEYKGEDYMIFESRIQTKTQISFELKMAKKNGNDSWKVVDSFSIKPKDLSQYVSSPSFLRINNIFFVSYSLKENNKYSIQFMKSEDLVTWKPEPSMAFLPDPSSDWDNEQTCYPFIWKKSDLEIGLLYNGNRYGKNGLGMAIWKM